MSFGPTQGTIRYATILDTTQAERSAQTLKNTFTQLGVSSTRTNSSITTLNRSFTAGVSQIKAQGNALANNTKQLQANSTQITTLGGKIKATASQFSTFAIGLSATASGVLQLAAGFRDYQDAQIAVERQQRKLSLAQEAYNKAQAKLKDLTDKGIRSGKAYAQAQLDVSQAQQQLSIMTQLLGERQEDLFDSQSQFVASVIPTTLGAIGTLGAAFQSLGGEKGMGGLVTKFKGFGGGLTGLMDKLKGATTSVTGFSGSILGIGAILGGSALLSGLIIQKVQEVQDAFDAAGIKFEKMKAGMAFSPTELLLSFDQLDELMHATGMSAVQLGEDMEGAKKKFVDAGGKLDAAGNIIWGSFNKAKEASKNLKAEIDKVPPSMNKAAKSTDAWVNMMVKAIQSADPNKIIEFNKAFKASGQSMDRYQQIVNQADVILKGFNKTITSSTDTVKKSTTAVGELWKIWEIGGGKMATITQGFGANINTLKEKFLALNAQRPTFRSFSADVGLFLDLLAKGNPTAITKTVKEFANLKTLQDQVNKGAKDLQQIWEKDAGAIALKKTNEEAAKLKATLAEGVKEFSIGLKIKDNSEKLAKDIIDNIDKKFRKPIKTKLQLRSDVKVDLVNFNNALKTAATLPEGQADAIVKAIIKTIDEKFKGKKGQFAGLRAQLSEAMKDPNTVKLLNETIAKGDYTAAGKGVVASVQTGIKAAAKAGAGLAGLWENAKPIMVPTEFIPPPTPPPAPKKPVEVPSHFITPPPIPPPKTPVKVPAVLDFGAKGGGGAGTSGGISAGFNLTGLKLPVKIPAVLTPAPPFPHGQGGPYNLAKNPLKNEFGSPKSRSYGIEQRYGALSPKDIEPPSNYYGSQPGDAYGDLGKEPNYPYPHRPKPENPTRFPMGNTIPTSAWMGGGAGGSSNMRTGSQAGAYGGPAAGGAGASNLLAQVAAVSKAIIDLGKLQPQISLLNTNAITAVQTTAGEIIKLGIIKPQISLMNTNAITAIQTTSGEIINLGKLKPQISLMNNNAISAISTTGSEIINLGKLKPQISLQNKNAFSAIDSTGKEIDKLTKLKPQISLQNRNAFSAIDAVKKEILKLENLKPNIKVSFSGTGTLKATGNAQLSGGGSIKIGQHGMKEQLSQDTMILAHAGEIAAIGKPEQGEIWKGLGDKGSSGMKGDLIVNNVIDLGGDRFVRSFKRKLGNDRYTFGA